MEPIPPLNLCFNQKYNSLMVTTPTYYRLFNLEEIDTSLRVKEAVLKKGITWAGALWDDLICAMILEPNSKQLVLWNLRAQTNKGTFDYMQSITAVKTNSKIIVVFFEDRFQIHNVNDMKNNVISKFISPNPKGICDFANLSDRYSFIAYPHFTSDEEKKKGILQIYDTGSIIRTANSKKTHSIIVDERPIVAIAFSPSGAEIATANTLGSLIKIFSSISGSKLLEVRRGNTGAFIRSLLFSTCGNYLVSTSNTTTIHVYQMKKDDGGPLAVMTSLLPSFLSQTRAFATARLKIAGSGRAFGIVKIREKLRLLVSTYYGSLYVYKINVDKGGECELIKKYNLLDENFKLVVALPPVRRGDNADDYDIFRDADDTPSTSGAAASRLAGTYPWVTLTSGVAGVTSTPTAAASGSANTASTSVPHAVHPLTDDQSSVDATSTSVPHPLHPLAVESDSTD